MCHLIFLMPALVLPVFWQWPLSIAAPVYAVILVLSAALYRLAMKVLRVPRRNGGDSVVGKTGQVVRIERRGITLRLGGELWIADVKGPDLATGDQVYITGIEGLRLHADKHDPRSGT